jgi:predicted RNA-binding Zn-ribbon protein involved in translation (DUF1610 family)
MNESQKGTVLGELIAEIEKLRHFRTFPCPACGASVRVHALQFYSHCPQCGEQRKWRSFGACGTELQDIIDAVLIWAGEGESFDAVMDRRAQILEDVDK